MGLALLQVSLFASLVILVSGASMRPRSIPDAGLVRGGGGGGGGGSTGGFGFGGGGGGGSGPSSEDSSGGQMEEDEKESDGKGIGGGGGGGGSWDGGSEESSEGQIDDGDSGDDGNEGDDNDEGSNGNGSDGDGSGNECEPDNDGDGGNDDGECEENSEDSTGVTDDDDKEEEEDADYGDEEEEDDDEEEEDAGDDGDVQGWGEGCGAKSTNPSDHKKRSINSIKSPEMGESSIPSSLWLSSGKNAPRSYYWEYDNGNNVISGGSDGGASHRPEDMSNVVTVIPYWVLSQFLRGLTFKMAPLGPIPQTLVSKHGITESHPLLRFKRDTSMMKGGESGETVLAAKAAKNENIGLSKEESSETEVDGNSESGEMETAEENPSEAGIDSEMMADEVSSASEYVDEESYNEEGGMHQEEVEEGSEVQEGGDIIDGSSGMNEIQSSVVEEALEITEEAMHPAMLNMLMLDPTATDSLRVQARAARSMERNGAEVVEDLTIALRSDSKSTGAVRSSPVDGVVGEPRNTRLLDGLLGQPLVDLALVVGR